MKTNPPIIDELKKVTWDYSIDEQTLVLIFEGKGGGFSINKQKLCARLLLGVKWYKLLDCLGVNGLKEILTDEVINLIWIKEIRERLFYAQKALHGT